MVDNAHIERMLGQLKCLRIVALHSLSSEVHPLALQRRNKALFNLIAVLVTFMNNICPVNVMKLARNQAHIHAAHTSCLSTVVQRRHPVVRDPHNSWVTVMLHFRGVCTGHAKQVPHSLHNTELHTKANHQARLLLFPCVASRSNNALCPTVAVAARQQDAIVLGKLLRRIFIRNIFRVNPVQIHTGQVRNTCMGHGFRHRQIGVVKLHIFANESDGDFSFRMSVALHHVFPFGQIRNSHWQGKFLANDIRKAFLFQHQGYIIQGRSIRILHYVTRFHIAEKGNLILSFCGNWQFSAADNHIRLNANGTHGFYTVLRGLGLHFSRSIQIRQQGDMNKAGIMLPYLPFHLANGLHKRRRFHIAHDAADFNDGNICTAIYCCQFDSALDFIRHMGNYLHSAAVILATQFPLHNPLMHLASGDAGFAPQIHISKAFIVTKIQVCRHAIIRDEGFAMLQRRQKPRIHIVIRIALLHRYLISPCFQQPSQRSGRNALPQGRNNAAGNKHIFGRHGQRSLFRPIHDSFFIVKVGFRSVKGGTS